MSARRVSPKPKSRSVAARLLAVTTLSTFMGVAALEPSLAQCHQAMHGHGHGARYSAPYTHSYTPSIAYAPPLAYSPIVVSRSVYFPAAGPYYAPRVPVAVYSAAFPAYFPWADVSAPPLFDHFIPSTLSATPALRELEAQVTMLEGQGRLSGSDASDLLERINDMRRLEQNERIAGEGSLDGYQYTNLQQNILSLRDQIRLRTAFSRTAQSCRRCGNVMTDPLHCCDQAVTATCKHRPALALAHECCGGENAVVIPAHKQMGDTRSIETVFKDLEALILKYNNAGRLGSFDLDSFGERLAELRYKQQLEARGGQLSKRQEDDLRQDLRVVEQEVLSRG